MQIKMFRNSEDETASRFKFIRKMLGNPKILRTFSEMEKLKWKN